MKVKSFLGKKIFLFAALLFAGITCDDNVYKDQKNDVQKYQSHPWHGVLSEAEDCKIVNAFIETSQGQKLDYAIDQKTGLLNLTGFFPNYIQIPSEFGFIPKTLSAQKEAIDIITLSSRRLEDQSLVESRVLGSLKINLNGQDYYTIIAAVTADPTYNGIYDIKQVPNHILDSIIQRVKIALGQLQITQRVQEAQRNAEQTLNTIKNNLRNIPGIDFLPKHALDAYLRGFNVQIDPARYEIRLQIEGAKQAIKVVEEGIKLYKKKYDGKY